MNHYQAFHMQFSPVRSLFVYIFLFLVGLNSSFSQNRSLSTMPLLQADAFNMNEVEDLSNTPAYSRCLRIYNKLVSARGDFRFPVPKLKLVRAVSKVASIDYDRLEIVLEERAYQTCDTLGDAALAFLLGHELTHYYEKHAWRRGFVSEFRELQIAKDLSKLQDQIAYETEADYLGGFLAYSAGFGLFNESAKVIKNLYESYQVHDPIPGYPALHDRIELTKKTSQKLKQLVELFDMANYLTAIGEYALAREYLKYVLMQFQSRELYNNLGMTCFLEALSYFDQKTELVFQYAVQLDLTSSARGETDIKTLRTNLLKQGLQYFDAAISMDPEYTPAYINKANSFALLGDTLKARFYAEQEALVTALNRSDLKSQADIKNLLGILKMKAGDPVQAELLWKQAIGLGSSVAENNLYLLQHGTSKAIEQESSTEVFETINGVGLISIAENLDYDRDKIVYLEGGHRYCPQYQDENSQPVSHYFFHQYPTNTEGTTEFVVFNKCNENYTGASARGIKIGDLIQSVMNKYGKPVNQIGTANGELLVYSDMVFIIKEQKVQNWINYAIVKK